VTNDPWVADMTLAELVAVRRRSRERIGILRVPMLAWAALLAVEAVWVLIAGRHAIVVSYAPLLVAMTLLNALYVRRAAREWGAQPHVYPWALAAVGLLVVSASVSRTAVALDLPWLEDIGPSLVFAIGVGLFAFWSRNSALAGASAGMIATVVVASALTDGDICVAIELAGFASWMLLAAALTGRAAAEHR